MSPFEHISIALVRPQHSGNIGATARSVANHGLGPLYLVDPPAFDPDRARWMAPHAQKFIDQARFVCNIPAAAEQVEVVIAATARSRKWKTPVLSLPQFIELSAQKRCLVLFGPEDSGLSNEDIKHAHYILTFPTFEHQSLNLSQAVNILGAHLMASVPITEQEEQDLPTPPPIGVTHKIQHLLVQEAMKVLTKSDYLNSRSPPQVHNQLLQLSSKFSHNDTVMLRGMCNKIFHKLRVLLDKTSNP